MPNKTDRIISYLPSTFQKRPRGVTLYPLLDAFGRELQDGENSLAALMQAHWVDYADRLATEINDLAQIGALYGLAPRPDEGVEEFREHLKRFVRTYLEGSVTVQGILRITAEALGLHIADEYAQLDSWWTRTGDTVTLTEPAGNDAAESVFGVRAASERGHSATSAQVHGTVDLSKGVDCREQNLLRLEVDGTGPFEINLATGADDPMNVSGELIADSINAEVGQPIAAFDGRFLTLTSPVRGPKSVIEVQDVLNDAAEQVLGVPPRAYYGRDEEAAIVRGLVDLSGVLDLSETRYLRLLIDGERLAEIDCAGPDEAHTLLDQIVENVNEALGLEAVSHDGRFLIITSPTPGLGSSIVFQQAAAQQALIRLFGPISKTHVGRGPRAARVVGRADLSGGVDLSERANIQLRLDGVELPVMICGGDNPAKTQLPELVATINEVAKTQLATHNGRFITLTSPTTGSSSEIVFLIPDEGEATDLIFGIGPREFRGHAAAPASLMGSPDLSEGVDLLARYLLRLSVDGHPPLTVNLRTHAEDIRAATPRELADAIDAAAGADVGATDGPHLILVSATEGSGSSLEIAPIAGTSQARFVTRAFVTDEASTAIFGFTHKTASGEDATGARVIGKVDIQRGLDLRENRYLRLVVDNHAPVEVDCAGVRPRATLIDEIVDKINQTLNLTPKVAAHDGRRLILVSHTLGANSRLRFEPPRTPDALALLLGVQPGEFRGQNAEQVHFVSTVDLSAGVDLSGGDQIKIGLDGADPVEIACAASATDPAHVKLNEIMIAINLALARNVTTHDGARLQITSPTVGAGSQLVFASPENNDATKTIFGIEAPREYHGRDAAPARVIGVQNLSNGVDLRVIRFLRLGVGRNAAQDVDCLLPNAADPTVVTLDEIVAAINNALKAKIATHDNTHLILSSPAVGAAGRLVIETHSSGDARKLIFGDVPEETTGTDAQPAVITGEVSLLQPADLSQRYAIRLAVDGDVPVEINVSGFSPATTFHEEIVAAINTVFPDMANLTEDFQLRLTSPLAGGKSCVDLLPLRAIDLIEYPPATVPASVQHVRHGEAWPVENSGAAPVFITARMTAPQGTSGPSLVNALQGWHIRLLIGLGVGETACLWADEGQLHAEIQTPLGARRIPGDRILVGPLGSQTWVPFEGTWPLSGDVTNPPSLQLNNPQANHIVQLHARQTVETGEAIQVAVTEGTLTPSGVDPVREDGRQVVMKGRVQTAPIPGTDEQAYKLVDGDGHVLAHLRAGAGVILAYYQGYVANVYGTIHPETTEPLLIAQRVEQLFNVTLSFTPEGSDPITESYANVTIGHDPSAPDALVRRVYTEPSQLVRAESLPKVTVLQLAQGRSTWRYLDCYGPRFDYSRFNEAIFPGGNCPDRGIFNVSRFAYSPPEPVQAVFTSVDDPPDPPVEVAFEMVRYQPGAFQVRLPADLPERFGGRFNQARFGQGNNNPELHEKAVTEPPEDDFYIVELLNRHSSLVETQIVPRVPLGWQAIPIPFREPQALTLGDATTSAQVYLTEAGIKGYLRIQAREPGTWGNAIAVAARASGPAMYDFSVIYQGVPFENARETVMGKPLAALAGASLEPGPIGVLQAKAAGVHVQIIRERTPETGV